MEQDNNQLILAQEVIYNNQLPEQLKKFYEEFSGATPGDYIAGFGFGFDNIPLGPINITIDNTRISVVDTQYYSSSKDKNIKFITLQGYAQLTLFDRFYATCVLVGQSNPPKLTSIVNLVDHLSKTEEEREELQKKEIDEVNLHPSFYASIYNDPINSAASTNGIYIIVDTKEMEITCDTVLHAIGIADFADNTSFGLAIGVSANINTFKNSMDFTVAASVRFAQSKRFTVAGQLGLLNGKINSIGLSLKSEIPLATEVFLTYAQITVKGFQEPKIAISLGGGIALGNKIKISSKLGLIQKALLPNLKDFYPVQLTVNCEINPAQDYYSFSGEGIFMGNFAVSASLSYDKGNFDGEFKAATVRNNYINGSLSVDFHKREDNWNIHGHFDCQVSLEWKNLVGITVGGGVDLFLNSQNYTVNNSVYNRKDLTITVAGMAKVKIVFTVNISVQKTWILNLSNQKISSPQLLLASINSGEINLKDNQDVLICESEDVLDANQEYVKITNNAIASDSWIIDEECSNAKVITFQVASQYTLVDSYWQLTYNNGNEIIVYTLENCENIITVKEFTHNYYELIIDNPNQGTWSLEILGDSQDTGKIYLDALQNEKIFSNLEIAEQTDSIIKFKYSAYTNSMDDNTLVRLFAKDISTAEKDNPFLGVIAYLEETSNGEYIWEIPEEFCNNAQYQFYISTATSEASLTSESNIVTTSIARQEANLDCSWELAYSADNANIITAYITIKNTGLESTSCKWELLDYTNTEDIYDEDIDSGNTASMAEVITSGNIIEIAGNSEVTFSTTITITDELKDNPSSLQLSVSKDNSNTNLFANNINNEDDVFAEDVDDIIFSSLNSMYCQEKTISWEIVENAAYYVLCYALEGNWEENGLYVTNIKDNYFTLSVAPGEYSYKIIAMDENHNAIGSWSNEEETEILFLDNQIINVTKDCKTSRSEMFSLNDGIYNLSGSSLENFTGTLTLYRNDIIKSSESNSTNKLKFKEKKILTLTFVKGKLSKDISNILLDNGDYFFEWTRKDKDQSSDSEISIELSGEVFSMEEADREAVTIGGEDSDVYTNSDGISMETLEGEVGFCNKDSIYQYITSDGGELSLTISSGTVFDAKVKLYIYVQSEKNGKYTKVKSLTINAGTYTQDTLIVNNLAIINNFYIQVVSYDNGKGKYNTDYSFDLSFNTFKDNVQTTDIIEVDGNPIKEWIGHQNNEGHIYLLQIDTKDLYAIRLEGDAKDAILKVCDIKGKVIKKLQIQSDNKAYIENLYLESGNYYVIVEAKDKGKGKNNTDYTLSVSKMQTLYPVDILEIDGENICNHLGYLNGSHTYRLEVNSNDRYSIRLDGDANEAILKICNLKGKVIKKLQIQSNNKAYIDDIYLEQGNYFIIVEAKDKGKGTCSTNYTLSASKLETLYPKIDNSNDTWKAASLLEAFEIDEDIEDWLGVGDNVDFFKISLNNDNNNPSYLSIELDEKTTQAIEEGIIKLTCCDASGRNLALYEVSSGQWGSKKTISCSEIYIGVTLKKSMEDVDYSLDTNLVTSLK